MWEIFVADHLAGAVPPSRPSSLSASLYGHQRLLLLAEKRRREDVSSGGLWSEEEKYQFGDYALGLRFLLLLLAHRMDGFVAAFA